MAKDGTESESRSVRETINGSHRYTVKGYSLFKGLGPGKYISSDVFNVAGYDWSIRFYPNGYNPQDNSQYVSVFLFLESRESTSIETLFGLTLLDQSRKRKHKVYRCNQPCKGVSWGYQHFIKKSELKASNYVKDDCIELLCMVGVLVEKTRIGHDRYSDLSINVTPTNLGDCLLGLLVSGIGSDLVFEVGDETFNAHKQILAARSSRFRAQFFGICGNADVNKFVVEDITPPIFKAMLHYIYSDSFPDLYEPQGKTSSSSSENFCQQLLAAADRYGLDRLKLLCEEKLFKEVKADSVAATLQLAQLHNCLQLKSLCLKFAASTENLGVVMQSRGYENLKESFPTIISELLQIVAANKGLMCQKSQSKDSELNVSQCSMYHEDNMNYKRNDKKCMLIFLFFILIVILACTYFL